MESDPEKKCNVCDRIFRPGESEHNIRKHINSHSCEKSKPAKIKKVMPKEKNILYSYFVKDPSKQTKDNESTQESTSTALPNPSSVQEMEASVQPSSSLLQCQNPIETQPLTSSSYIKCSGLNLILPPSSNIYESFPFALLPIKNFAFENGNFHHLVCANQQYVLTDKEPNTTMNKACFSIQFFESFKKLSKNILDENYFESTTHDINLSHMQMKQRLDKFRQDSNNLRISQFNLSKKILAYTKPLVSTRDL